MSSPTDRRTVIVGLFVFLGVVIFGGGILAVGNLEDTFGRKIAVTAVFGEVSGLKAGDKVWSSGLKVGTVETLGFIGPGQVEVTLQLDANVTPYIHADAVAKIGSDGLIGNPIVVVSSGSAEAPPIADGAQINTREGIATEDVIAMLQENNKNLLAITTDIKAVTARLAAGEGTVGKLLKDDTLLTQVSDAVATLDEAAENARRLTASLATFSARLNQPGQLPHDLVTDTTTMAGVRATVEKLEATATRAEELVGALEASATDPTSPVGVLLGDEAAGGDLKTTLANLTTASQLLNEDLKAIQSNFLFRPYFKKKEREARKAERQAR